MLRTALRMAAALLMATMVGGLPGPGPLGLRVSAADPEAPDLAVSILGDLYTMESDGTDQVRRTSTADQELNPDWSPDGSRIAFSRIAATVPGHYRIHLYTMRADGSSVTRVTSGAPDDWTPSWSPDGTRLVFSRWDPADDTGRIFAVDADGANLTQLTSASGTIGDASPDWSPDGTRIAFVRGNAAVSRSSVFLMGADGTGLTRLTPTAGGFAHAQVWSPAWSPDGGEIAFTVSSSTEQAIYTVRPDGSGLTRIQSSATSLHHPSWSPDGSQLVFTRDNAGSRLVGVMNADGSDTASLYRTVGEDPDWNPVVGVEPIRACRGYVVTVHAGTGGSPTPAGDVIEGTPAADVIDGLGGRDLVCGLAGDDLLTGGNGEDALQGARGEDTLVGAAGDDLLTGGAGTDTCRGGTGADHATTCETVSGVP